MAVETDSDRAILAAKAKRPPLGTATPEKVAAAAKASRANANVQATLEANLPPRPTLGATKQCATCDGSGKIRGGHVKCPTCHGSGTVPK